MDGLKRLTFWRPHFVDGQALRALDSDDLLSYAILKRDVVSARSINSWHVFESVLVKYPHAHNCIHGAKPYRVRAGAHEFQVTGVMYCQQNELNKACAQVALRSLCTMHMADTELPYSRINHLAVRATGPFDPANGLRATQIQTVLRGLRIGFTDVDYSLLESQARRQLPYQKFLYAGIESGAGALLGFKLTGTAS